MSSTPPPITQNPDIRFLGRLLGDVIKVYGGEQLFRRIEYIRSASVDRARGIVDAHSIDPGLDALSLDDTLAFVRGFMLFSMLANLAEDRQGVAAETDADVAHAVARLEAEGIGRDRVMALLDHALVVPVLTAHPTEVSRKSVIDHRNLIAQLMALRDTAATETPDGDLVDEAIARQIALLWRTRPLRRERLYVVDEIEIALMVFGRAERQVTRIRDVTDQYRASTMKVLRVTFLSGFTLELAASLSVALVAVSIGLRLVAGDMSFAPGLFVLILAPEVFLPIRNVGAAFHASTAGLEASRDALDVLGDDRSDGAAAVEQALKIAFQYWWNRGVEGRTTFLAFGDAYHGDTIGALSLGDGGFGTDLFDPLRFPVLRAPGFTDPECFARAIAMVAAHAHELAAVVVEPLVQGAGGMLLGDVDGLAALARACRFLSRHFDEG